MNYDKNWARIDVGSIPDIKVTPPGPKSIELHARAEKYMKGYSSQVKLFPVAFESGSGVTLTIWFYIFKPYLWYKIPQICIIMQL